MLYTTYISVSTLLRKISLLLVSALMFLVSASIINAQTVLLNDAAGFSYTGNDASEGPDYSLDISNCYKIEYSFDYEFSLPWEGTGNMENADECPFPFDPAVVCPGDPNTPGIGNCSNCWDFLWWYGNVDGAPLFEDIIGESGTDNTEQMGSKMGAFCVDGTTLDFSLRTQVWSSDETSTVTNIMVLCWEQDLTLSSDDPVCVGDDINLTSTTMDPNITNYSWSTDGAATINSPNTANTSVSNAVNGETFTLTVSGIDGCSYEETITVVVNQCCPPNIASVIPSAVTIVSESSCTNCLLDGGLLNDIDDCPTGSTKIYSIDGGTTWSSTLPTYDQQNAMTILSKCECDSDPTITSTTPSVITTTPGTCDVGSVEITFFPSGPLCEGECADFTMVVTGSSDQIITFDVGGVANTSSPLPPDTYIFTLCNNVAGGEFFYDSFSSSVFEITAIESQDGCPGTIINGVHTVNLASTPTANTTSFDECDLTMVDLDALSPAVNNDPGTTVSWYEGDPNGTGTFINTNPYDVSSGDIWVLIENNEGCTTAVPITFTQMNCCPDITINSFPSLICEGDCGTVEIENTSSSETVNVVFEIGVFTYTIPVPPGTMTFEICNSGTPSTSESFDLGILPEGTYNINIPTITTSNGCVIDLDDQSLTLTDQVIATFVQTIYEVCQGDAFTLPTPNNSVTGLWDNPYTVPGTYTFTPDAPCNEPTIITVTEIPCDCANPPGISITPVTSICVGDVINLEAVLSGSATSNNPWQSTGDGVFDDINSLTTFYTPSPGDINNGFVTILAWTNDPDGPDGPCVSGGDQITIDIQSVLNAGDDSNLTLCEGSALSATILWNSLTGNPDIDGTWSPSIPSTATSDATYTYLVSNDCGSDMSSVTLTVTNTVNAGDDGNIDICVGNTVTENMFLAALGPNAQDGGTWSPALPSIASSNGTYTYSINNNCGMDDAMVTLNVTDYIEPIVSDITYCQGQMISEIMLSAPSGLNPEWFQGSTLVGSGTSFTPSTAGTYRVAYSDGSCTSDTISFNVTEIVTSAPDVMDVNYCLNDPASTLTATGTGTLVWYDSETSTTPLSGAPTPSTGTVADIEYWVSQIENGCESTRVKITVTIEDCSTGGCNNPAVITDISSIGTICSGNSVALNVTTNVAGGTWSVVLGSGTFDNPTAKTTNFTPTSDGTITIRYTTDDPDGMDVCEAVSEDVTFQVNTTPVAIDPSDIEICAGESVIDLTASNDAINSDYSITWYSDAGLTSPVADPSNYPASGPSTVYAQVTNNACTSNVVEVSIMVVSTKRGEFTIDLCPEEESMFFTYPVDYNTEPFEYSILTGSVAGCDSIVDVSINQLEHEVADINLTACTGSTINILGQPFTAQNPSGQISRLGQATTGCDSVYNIDITFIDEIVEPYPLEICEGETVNIQGQDISDSDNGTMIPIPGGTQSAGCDSLIQINLNVLANSQFTYLETICDDMIEVTIGSDVYNFNNPTGTSIISNAVGCDSVVNVDLTYQVLHAEISPTPTCLDKQSEFDVVVNSISGGSEPYHITAPGVDAMIQNADLPFTLTTNSALGAVTIADDNGCEIELDYSVEFNAELNLELVESDGTLTITGSDADLGMVTEISWNQPELVSCGDCFETEIIASASDGNYSVDIHYGDDCIQTLTIFIAEKKFEYMPPNIIRPSSGSNGTFFVQIPDGSTDRVLKMSIFDRWGNNVYNSEDEEFLSNLGGWTGRYGQNGSPVDNGVYVYKITMLINGAEELLIGDVTVQK